jgi:predicted metalloprotease
MKWEGERRSTNVDDRRGASGGGGFGGGLGDLFGRRRSSGGGLNIPMGGAGGRGGGMSLWIIVAIGAIAWFVFGINPLQLLGGMMGGGSSSLGGSARQSPAPTSVESDRQAAFSETVFAFTEDVWTEIFRGAGRTYDPPTLTLFTGATQTACGTGQAAMGPFYCPADQRVYLDLDFFNELATRFQAAGDFAQAYVIAHEVGHHVQTLIGVSTQVARERQGRSEEEANALSVRQELQADCFAGVWAARAKTSKGESIIEAGDIDEALAAAAGVGDDTIQQRSQGYVVPESFTHGTSAQRQKWFKIGFQSGDMNRCDTFNANPL